MPKKSQYINVVSNIMDGELYKSLCLELNSPLYKWPFKVKSDMCSILCLSKYVVLNHELLSTRVSLPNFLD